MRKKFYIVLWVALCISLAGCWSRHEPKTLALINSVIYDITDTDHIATVEIVNPSAQGAPAGDGNGKNPTITTSGQGGSFSEAIRNISESVERTIFGGQTQVRFFSERFAQDSVMPAMDYILRDYLTDENSLIVIIQHEDPKQIYNCIIGLSDSVGDYITALSKTQPSITSKSVFVKTLDFVKDYYKEGKQPVAEVIRLVECEATPPDSTKTEPIGSQNSDKKQGDPDKNYRIIYGGLAAFRDDKFVGYMDEIEARAYNFVTNNIDRAIISINTEDNQTAAVVRNSKAAIETEIENGQITMNVKIKVYMDIVQENSSIDINKKEVLKNIEANFNKQMTEEITSAIKKAQTELQSDIFGFGVSIHKQHPQKWKEIQAGWDDYFVDATINVLVESTVDRQGELKQPFRREAG